MFSKKFDIIMDRVYEIKEAYCLMFVIKHSKSVVKVPFVKFWFDIMVFFKCAASYDGYICAGKLFPYVYY